MTVRKLVFLLSAFLAVATTSLRTTEAGTIAVQFAETNTNEVTITWSGSYDTTGYTGPSTQTGNEVFGQGIHTGTGSSGDRTFDLALISSGSTLNNLQQYSATSGSGSFILTGSVVNYAFSNTNTTVTNFSGNPFSFLYDTSVGNTVFIKFEDAGSSGVHTVSGSATISGTGATLSSIFPSGAERIALSAGPATNFSDGIGNNVTFQIVPEPTSYAMLLAGVGCGAAGLVRRRRHSVSTR